MNSVNALFRRVSNPALLLIAADLLVALIAFYGAVLVRLGVETRTGLPGLEGSIELRALVFTGFVLFGLLSMGLYRARQRPTVREIVVRVTLAMLLAALACIVTFFVFPALFTGRGVLGLAVLLAGLGIYGVRRLALPVLDTSRVKRRVLVLGIGQAANKIGMLRRRADRRRFEVVGFVPANQGERESAERLGIAPLHELTLGSIHGLRVDEVVVALDDRRGAFPVEELLRLKLSGIPVTDVVSFLERETEKIDLDVLHPAWLLFEHSRHTEIAFRWFKRWFDLCFGSVLLVLSAPLVGLAALAILLESGWRKPVFYRQARVGRHGKVFELLKFRSMRVDAESDGAQWSQDGDDRVTRVGQWLRRFRIDELPQLINIIRGDMSVVGPRPERPEFVEELTAAVPLYYYRHCIRPGLAGWAQLNFPYGASIEDARQKLKYDLYYIKNAGIINDFLILMQTAEVVFLGRGTAMAGRQQRLDEADDEAAGDAADSSGGRNESESRDAA